MELLTDPSIIKGILAIAFVGLVFWIGNNELRGPREKR